MSDTLSENYSKLNKRYQEIKNQLADVEAKLAESEEQLKEELVEKKGLERALSACNRQNDEFAEMIKKLVREKEELKEQLANQNQDQQITELRELHAIKDDASECITINGVKFSYEQMLIIDEVNNNYSMNIKKLNQQLKQQIADLEAKLAESEKQIKDARETSNMSVDSWCKNRRKYEAQTAEMQNKLFILYSMLYETLEKQCCDNVASQIAQMTDWTYDKEADWLKGNRNYDQLKQQLAEKDEEIAYLTKQVKKFNNEAQKYFEDAYCNDSICQDKISFCIEQLEKVKETTECILDNALKNSSLNQSYYDILLDEIDNQIKQLKVKAERS